MGSRSSSVNRSETDYITDTQNLNLQGVDAGGGNVIAGNSGQVNVLDGGAIKESFNFGKNALDFGGNALDFAGTFGDNALDFAETVNQRAMDEMDKTFSETLGTVAKNTEQIVSKVTLDSGERVQKSMQLVVWLAVAAIIGFAVMGKRASA